MKFKLCPLANPTSFLAEKEKTKNKQVIKGATY